MKVKSLDDCWFLRCYSFRSAPSWSAREMRRNAKNPGDLPPPQSTGISTTVDNQEGHPTLAGTLADLLKSDGAQYTTPTSFWQEEFQRQDNEC